MNNQERQLRVIARGEHSNHAHIIVGNATIEKKGNETIITVNDDLVKIRHLLESNWLADGNETWTQEHHDIAIEKGTYKFIQQVEYNPLNEAIQNVAD
jgi:hypothetical protein